jgi:hypothetical protein
MADRILVCQCPHCKDMVDVFVLVGQTFEYVCDKCGLVIYFDETGNVYEYLSPELIDDMERERDFYISKGSEISIINKAF